MATVHELHRQAMKVFPIPKRYAAPDGGNGRQARSLPQRELRLGELSASPSLTHTSTRHWRTADRHGFFTADTSFSSTCGDITPRDKTTCPPVSYRLYCLCWRCAVGMRSTARGQRVIGVVCSTPTTFERPGSIMQGRGGCLLGGRYRKLTSVDRACRGQGSVRNVPDPTILPSASRV
jgi:hypothetical protein